MLFRSNVWTQEDILKEVLLELRYENQKCVAWGIEGEKEFWVEKTSRKIHKT